MKAGRQKNIIDQKFKSLVKIKNTLNKIKIADQFNL